MDINDQYMDNLFEQAEGLVGGMALPYGVMFMSAHGVGVGYHDRKGQLHRISRPLNPAWMRRIGMAGAVLWMFIEWSITLFSMIFASTSEQDRRIVLAGMVTGFLISGILSLFGPDFENIGLAILILVVLAFLLIPSLRHHLQEIRRHHGAEHQLIHAVGLGETPSQESLARQTVFHTRFG